MHHVQRPGQRIARHLTPGTLDEALALLAEAGPSARPVAGATDLTLELARGGRPGVDTLVDLTRIAGLDTIELDDGAGVLRLGALVTHGDVIASAACVEHALPLAQASLEVGAPALRTRATVVGNIVTASPANDTISALQALDAVVVTRTLDGGRRIPIADFHPGFRQTVLAPGELVTAVEIPVVPGRRGLFAKLGLRRAQAISVVHVAVTLDLDGDTVTAARVAAGSVAATVVRLAGAEAALVGTALTSETIAAAAAAAQAEVHPIADVRGTAEYRTDTIEVLVRRVLRTLARGEERSRWPEAPVLLGADRHPSRGPAHAAAHDDATPVEAVVNGMPVAAVNGAGASLLDWLRDSAGPAAGVTLTGTKEGCAEGECGACTVHMDGVAVLSCLVPAARAHGTELTTVEGLGGSGAAHPLQQAFITEGAAQCGFCTPGFLMAGAKLLEERPEPSPEEVVAGLAGNLCRCTGYCSIVASVDQAATVLAGTMLAGSVLAGAETPVEVAR